MAQLSSLPGQLVLQSVPEHESALQDSPSQLNHELWLKEQPVPTHPVLQSGPSQVCWHASPTQVSTQSLEVLQPSPLIVQPEPPNSPSQVVMQLSSAQPELQSVPEHVTESQEPPPQLDHEMALVEQSVPAHPVSQSGPLQVCWHPSPSQVR